MRDKSIRKIKTLFIIMVIILLLFSIVSMIAIKKLYDDSFPRYDRPEFTTYFSYTDVSENYECDRVQFESGENKLVGYIYGQENSKGLVVVAHGIGGGADRYLAEIMSFVDNGWRVFTYDCTGSYDSEGKGTTGFPQSVLDLDAALAYIESNKEFSGLPIMLFGHSWGGYAVANVLNYDHDITGVVSVAGVNTAMEVVMEEANNIMGPVSYIEAPYIWAYQKFLYGKTAELSAVNGINKSDVSVMIIHGDGDTTVPYDGSSIISHKDEITNANVIYKTCSKENHNGHCDLFLSDAALEYAAQIDVQYLELYNNYQGEIPYQVERKFYERIDKYLVNELDTDIMNEINSFYEDNLMKTF